MITFKKYHHAPTRVKAVCYSGDMRDAEELEAIYKGKIRLEFRGCFSGCIVVESLGGQRQRAKAGDYLVDSADFGLFVLVPELFQKYYEAIK
jgi:hypothetical protein